LTYKKVTPKARVKLNRLLMATAVYDPERDLRSLHLIIFEYSVGQV